MKQLRLCFLFNPPSSHMNMDRLPCQVHKAEPVLVWRTAASRSRATQSAPDISTAVIIKVKTHSACYGFIIKTIMGA